MTELAGVFSSQQRGEYLMEDLFAVCLYGVRSPAILIKPI